MTNKIIMIKTKLMNIKEPEYTKSLRSAYMEIIDLLKTSFGLETEYLGKKPSWWGYSTSCYYLKAKNGEYVVSISKYSPNKAALVKKDIFLSNLIGLSFPTSSHLKTTKNADFIVKNGYIIKINHFISGTPPFDMNMKILKNAVKILKLIHSIQAPGIKIDSPKRLSIYDNKKFLHGDLTPSNMLVSNNKIVCILDFEHCILGPVEWDLATCLVFSWYRMYETISFETALKAAINYYGSKEINKSLLLKFSYEISETYLKNIVKNRLKYENKDWWNVEHEFAKKRTGYLKTLLQDK